MSRTKDESFLLRLYDVVIQHEDIYGPVDRYEIGHAIGLHPKGVETICKTLLRTNFIKQDHDDPHLITITQNGIKLAKQIKEESKL